MKDSSELLIEVNSDVNKQVVEPLLDERIKLLWLQPNLTEKSYAKKPNKRKMAVKQPSQNWGKQKYIPPHPDREEQPQTPQSPVLADASVYPTSKHHSNNSASTDEASIVKPCEAHKDIKEAKPNINNHPGDQRIRVQIKPRTVNIQNDLIHGDKYVISNHPPPQRKLTEKSTSDPSLHRFTFVFL